MRDYVDGSGFKEHELFAVKKNALQIFFYFDELEVCNPLGSKAKTHKLGRCQSVCVGAWVYTVYTYACICMQEPHRLCTQQCLRVAPMQETD